MKIYILQFKYKNLWVDEHTYKHFISAWINMINQAISDDIHAFRIIRRTSK